MRDLQSDILIELHVPDFETVKDFYCKLGYEVVWEKTPREREGYLVLRSGHSVLNFYCGNDHVYEHSYFKRFSRNTPRGYGVEIIIPVTGIAKFYDQFKRIYPDNIVGELYKRHSRADFRVTDPFGYYLRFVERYNWVDGRDKKGNVVKKEG